MNRFTVCMGATLLAAALFWSSCVHAQGVSPANEPSTPDAARAKVQATQQRLDALYGSWDPKAFEEMDKARACITKGGTDCPRDPCKPIRTRLEWLGDYCQALAAEAARDTRKYQRALDRALLGLPRNMSDEHKAQDRYLSDIHSSRGEKRARDISDAMEHYVFAYRMWVHAKILAMQKEQENADLTSRAEAGEADAQFELGFVHYNDRNTSDHLEQAAVWFRRAAEQRHAGAQNFMGTIHTNGEGVSQNFAEAIIWFRKAAEQGYTDAQHHLGIIYHFGMGVLEDEAQAAAWYRKAAEQGHAGAQNNLGSMYENALGVPRDEVQAVAWYRKAAEQRHAAAQYNLGRAYADGTGVPRDETQAATWYRAAAEQGEADAQANLGVMYSNGQGVPKDYTQAITWLGKAAEQGHAGAQNNLGLSYAKGQGVPKDEIHAAAWYRKAAEQGHAEAQNNLGLMYLLGRGVQKDGEQALAWFLKAAGQENANAYNNLGIMLEDGLGGFVKDYAEAASWYRKAAMQGLAFAQRNLARLYHKGLGVKQSSVTAYAWMNLAAAGGHENAPDDRDQIAAELSPADLQKAQALSRQWQLGESIPEVAATTPVRPASKPTPTAALPRDSSGSRFPARPAKKPGVVSCNTNCINGDCYRTYDDGRQVRIRATHRMNAFGEWEWDSGSC